MTEQVGAAEDDSDGISAGCGTPRLVTGPPNFHTAAHRAASRPSRGSSGPRGQREATADRTGPALSRPGPGLGADGDGHGEPVGGHAAVAAAARAGERPVPPFVAGVDVGGTKTLAVVIDGRGESVAQVRLATDTAGSRGLIATVEEALVEVAEGVGLAPDGLAAVGIGVPGLVDPRNEGLRHAVNLDIGDAPVSLHDPVRRLIGGPVIVGNDVNLAALGAAELFGREGIVAYLSVGTGLAAGFVIDGEVFAGARGVAGEIGHLPVDPYGAICECGQTGCLETVASGAAIARRWVNPTGGPSDAGSLLAAASAGDREAMEIRDEVCGYLAWAVALIAQTVDPEVVVLGGGVAEAGAPLLDAVRAALTRRAAVSPFVASLGLAERVTIVPPGVTLGAVGAARAARNLLAIEGGHDGPS